MNRDTRIANLEARRAMTSDSANWIAYVDKLVECLSARDATIREGLERELDEMPAPQMRGSNFNDSNAFFTDDICAAIARGAVGHAGRRGSGNHEDNKTDNELSSLDVAADDTF